MRTVSQPQINQELARERRVCYLWHFYIDDAAGDRIWDWCYTDNDSEIVFTGVDAVERTFKPVAIRFDDSETVMAQSSDLNSGKRLTMIVQRIEPFINFFGSRFPFPVKVNGYKIYLEDLTFYDVLPLDEVGTVEIEGVQVTVGIIGKFRILSRKAPQPVYGPGCWKRLFSTGQFGCRADKAFVTRGPFKPTAIDQNIIWFKQAEVLALGAGWLDRGLFEYLATVEPEVGTPKDIKLAPNIIASFFEIREDPDNPGDNVNMMRVELDYPPHALTVDLDVTLIGGCTRTIVACRDKHQPVDYAPITPGTVTLQAFVRGGLKIHVQGNNLWLEAVFQQNDVFLLPDTITVNGNAWAPTWTDGISNMYTPLVPVMPSAPFKMTLERLLGSHAVTSITTPSTENSYIAVVGINVADPLGASHTDTYQVRIGWLQGLVGNLGNFGGTPYIPSDNGVQKSTIKCN